MRLSSTDTQLAVKQLFDRHFHQLVLSSFRYVNDYNQAEDIVQDVFVKVWQNFDDLQPIDNWKAYLFKSVKNSSLNYLRHIQVRQKFIVNADELPSPLEKSAEDCKIEEETNNRIHTAVNKLPDHWKEAFVHSKYDHLKYHEIAEKLNISQKTVEKYISKSLQLLRHELKDLILLVIFVLELFF